MSQTKAQLVAPVGVVTATAMTVSGVLTATTYDGNITGAAVSIAQGKNLNVGVVTVSGIAGDITGSATSITQGTNVTFGSLTATFVGDFTGTASSIMPGSNVTAGVVTASSFSGPVTGDVTGNLTGNVTGTAGSITSGNNLRAGIATITGAVGDGSNLTGVAGTSFNTQTVTADGATTAIDLSAGNIITFNQSASTTVSFANTSEAMSLAIIRKPDETETTITWPDSVKWNNDTTPTLIKNPRTIDAQQFQFITRDSGLNWYAWENMAVDPQNSKLWVMGNNTYGQLAQNTSSNPSKRSSPVQIPGTTWSHINYTGSEDGNGAIWGTKVDGTMWGWGIGEFGTLGFNSVTPGNTGYSSPTQLPGTTWAFGHGSGHCSTAVKTDGTLWSWGYNHSGQLGQNDRTERSSPCQIPGTTWSTDPKKLCSNSRTPGDKPGATFAIKTDGTMWGWGQNNSWKWIQNPGPTPGRSSPTLIPGGDNWDTVSVSTQSVLAVKTNGEMWAWGYNEYKQLGLNQPDSSTVYVDAMAQLPGDWATGYQKVSQGFTAAAAIKANGTLWTWGVASNGQLGHGNASSYSSPRQVGTDTTWDRVCLQKYITMATKTDGTAWGWGRNQFGELGLNDRIGRSSPTQLAGTWQGAIGGAGGNSAFYLLEPTD